MTWWAWWLTPRCEGANGPLQTGRHQWRDTARPLLFPARPEAKGLEFSRGKIQLYWCWDLDVEQIQVVLTFLELLMILIIITNLNSSSNMFYQYHLSFYNLLRYHLNDGYLPYLSLYNFLSSHSYCHLPFNLLMTRWWAFTMWLLRPCRCHDAISADIRFFGQFFFPGKLPEKEVTVAGSGQFRGNSKKKGSRFWEKFLWKVPGRFSVE